MTVRIMTGDCREMLKTLPDASVDSIVTDPPYGLSFMGKAWDYGVPGVDVWRECFRVLKPGGHLLSFAGTRTQHRMAVNIEDAGFEIRDMIAWVYGSGFPKSLDVSKAIDKAAGAEREVVGFYESPEGTTGWKGQNKVGSVDFGASRYEDGARRPVTAPATEQARQWQGWGSALKPALEPITVARKPLIGTIAANVLQHGTGALNIDGCRVGTDESLQGSTVRDDIRGGRFAAGHSPNPGDIPAYAQHAAGRWPANLIHDGSDEVVALFPKQAGAAAPVRGTEASQASIGHITGERARVPGAFHSDSGSAARFFYTAKASQADREIGMAGMPQHINAEWPQAGVAAGARRGAAPRSNNHPTVKPTDLMQYLCRLVTPPGGTVLDPFCGSGSTLIAADREGFNAIGIELDPAYAEIARRRVSGDCPLFSEVA